MRAFGRSITIAAVLVSLAGMAGAAEVRVLSVGAVQYAVKSLAADFAKESGHQVIFTTGSPAIVMQRSRMVRPTTRSSSPSRPWTSSTRTASSTRRAGCGSPPPAWASRCARVRRCRACRRPMPFKQALLDAKSIVYGDPTLPNQSGEKAEKILAKAGLLDALKPKLKIAQASL